METDQLGRMSPDANGGYPPPAAKAITPETTRLLQDALATHQRGRLAEAERLYGEVLERAPRHADAHHLLGLVYHQQGAHDRAINQIDRAIALNPENPLFHFNRGVSLAAIGKKERAAASYHRAIEGSPGYAQAHFNLGNLHRDAGETEAAEEQYRKAVQADPAYSKAYLNLAGLLMETGRAEAALDCLSDAERRASDRVGILFKRAMALKSLNRIDDAVAAYRSVLDLQPKFPKADNNLGNIFQEIGDFDKAFHHYRRAIETDPAYTIGRFNLGNLYQLRNEMDRALAEYRQVLRDQPENPEAWLNLGQALRRKGETEEALDALNRALEIQPGYEKALAALVHQLQYACEWDRLAELMPRLDEGTRKRLAEGALPAENPFENLTRHGDPRRNFAVARLYSAHVQASVFHIDAEFDFSGRENRTGPLTVGYVSNDFYNHPVAHLIQGLFAAHDRSRFRVIAYSHGQDDGSVYRHRIRTECDAFVDIRDLSYVEAARRMVADGVDILVDLMGHTLNNRLEIFALRPAPVQVAFLGYPGTTGADFLDYMIVDATVAPRKHAPFFSEKPVYMPHCYQVNDRQPVADVSLRREDYGLPADGMVFCSFNQSYKIDRPTFHAWMEILRAVPGGVLWLLRSDPLAERNLKAAARSRDVDPDRLVFADRAPKDVHLARQRLADLGLDTRLVNGHTTSSDLLWSGVPLLTMEGPHFASRVASAILRAAGLPELVTGNLEEYQARAVALARNPQELAELKKRLADQRNASPLFDTERYARNLERAFLGMWNRFREKAPPHPLEVREDREAAFPIELPAAAEASASGKRAVTPAEAHRINQGLKEAQQAQKDGRSEDALAAYQRVLDIWPESIAALGNQGAIYHGLGRLDEAEECYRRVLALKPESYEAYNNLGNVHETRGKTDEAIACYEKAVEIKPDFAEGFNNLGLAHKGKGQNAEAIRNYEKALSINPDLDRSLNGVVYLYQQFCHWDKVDRANAELDRLTRKALAEDRRPAESPFTNLCRTADIQVNYEVSRAWGKDISRRMAGTGVAFDFASRRVEKSRLCIGYLSCDFYNHATAHLMRNMFQRHNRDRFRIHCYSYGKDDGSHYIHGIREGCDRFVDIKEMSHADAARRICEDGVDILVELKGYTKDNRLEIPALRPAPVQVGWLGFPGTYGADFIDYVITDRIITPPEHRPHYSEHPVYMPHTYQVNDDRERIAPKKWTRKEAGLPERGFVFCSFNQAYKFTPAVYGAWLRMLKRTPDSVLWVIPRSGAAEKVLKERAIAEGVAPERIVCSRPIRKDQHLARHQLADLGLDTHIVNGHTTTSDALWAGLPVITFQGTHFASRVSASLLSAAGLPDLVAPDLAGYEELAVELAADPDRLDDLRRRLRENRITHPLFDTSRFVRNLEKGFEAMWRRFQNGEPPAEIEVRDDAPPAPFNALPLPAAFGDEAAEKKRRLWRSGADLYDEGRMGGAAEAFREAAGDFPEEPVFRINLGHVSFLQGDFSAAEAAFREAVRLGGNREPKSLLALGAFLAESGRWAEARPLLEQFVETRPESPEAAFWRGQFALAEQRPDSALEQFDGSAEAGVLVAESFLGKSIAFQQKAEFRKSVFWAQRALAFHPLFPEAFLRLAQSFRRLGLTWEAEYARERAGNGLAGSIDAIGIPLFRDAASDAPAGPAAIRVFRPVLATLPEEPAAPSDIEEDANESMGPVRQELSVPDAMRKGIEAHKKGDSAQAMKIYQAVLEAAPEHADALHLLGVANFQEGNPADAVPLIEKAIARNPEVAAYHSNLGAAFQGMGSLGKAEACYRKALGLSPDYPDALLNMGNIAKMKGDLEGALTHYQQALAVRPDHANVMNAIGLVYQKRGDKAEARKWLEKAVAAQPNFAEAHYNLACALDSQSAAIEGLRKVLELAPGHEKGLANLVHRLYHVCDWRETARLGPDLDRITDRQIAEGKKSGEQPLMNLVRHADPERNLMVARSWASYAAKMVAEHPGFDFPEPGSKDRPIRVGYVSGDFRNHPVGHLIAGLFAAHDRRAVEVFAYSFGPDDASEYRRRIREGADHFRDIRTMGFAAAGDAIHADGIDILVDLMGHTGGENRMEICALRPAPLVCTWLGFPGTSGADFMDYIITDQTVTPDLHLPWYTEQPVFLPHAYQVNDGEQIISGRNFTRAEQGLPETGFVFASFNQVYKVDPEMFDVWARLLTAVEDSVLWLFTSEPLARENLRREAKARGIQPERLVFADRLPKPDHLSRQRLADLGLDTRLVNGHTTTSDALWSGLPVVTLRGTNFASRVAASLLKAMELPELVADSLSEYESLALELARDGEKLAALREKLAGKRKTAPLFDTQRFARNLEAAFMEMWRKHRDGETPSRIDVVEKASG